MPDRKLLLWVLLAIPAAHLLYRWRAEQLWPDDLVAPTGEWAARMVIFALMLTPLSMLMPRARPVKWLLRHRRSFGVAAFGYALLHLAFYVGEMETVRNMLAEFLALGIWTGWAALALMLPPAITSNDASMRALKAAWKTLQRLAYPTALLILVHWIFVHNERTEALLHFAPLVLLQLYRLTRLARARVAGSPVHSPA